MSDAIQEFGTLLPEQTYVPRPGGYGVIRDAGGRVAVVATPRGIFLPGGGQEAGETVEQALHREVLEECGFAVRILARIGVAFQLVYSPEDRTHYRKHCTFFACRVAADEPAVAIAEPDHELGWLPVAVAMAQLTHQSQRWAVAESINSSSHDF